jgi:MFS family permease
MSNPSKADRYAKAAELTARIDRLPAMVLPTSVILALAFGYFIALYDVIDVGIAFSETSLAYTGLTQSDAATVVSMGLFGYIPGAILLGYFADKYGRKPMLIFTALLTAIGSLGNAFSYNLPTFALFRFITGMGIGGDLILVPTYIVEMVPAARRGQYFNLVYIAGWAGLGLGPFLASVIDLLNPAIGWRVIFLIGATLAFIVLIIRSHADETVRMLALKGKLKEAEDIVARMEQKAKEKTGLSELPPYNPLNYRVEEKNPFSVFLNRTYAVRIIAVMLAIFFFYFGEYPYLTEYLLWAGSAVPSSQINTYTFLFGLAGVATFFGAIALRFVVERVRRAVLTTIAYAVGMLMGVALTVALTIAGNPYAAFVGMLLTNFIGVGWSNQLNYLNGTENVPTYARATSFAISDGAAHLGAAISTAVILSAIDATKNPLLVWTVFQVPMVVMGIILIFVLPNTIGQSLERVNEAQAGI